MSSTIPVILTILGAMVGSGGILFGATRYNREEAGKVVAQQTSVLTDMRGLNDELVEALDRVRNERDTFRAERDVLRAELQAATGEIRALREHISELEDKISELHTTITDLNGKIRKRPP